ncbi:DUF2974 domain-containing protein [Streptococcus moroccensis]|uniref:DUF2974 domain-containing protein n=1 Tax=Streptococcus moroccensis TaxID=1451356 RepID=A0ABT9YPF2_9STRE|nr:DUF2974 domain-containing protein [Streptococcus moroccensis]MDQ0221599.1 hypothetical protein [Streptococcus moroccensis]
MSNLIQYVHETAHLNFYDLEPNEVDALVLTELSYLPFEDIVSPDFTKVRLFEVTERYFTKHGNKPTSVIVHQNRLNLLKAVAQSKRYKNIKVLAYRNEYDLDLQKQFAAVTFEWRPRHYHVAFRGTDDTIIGWKEDFHLTYMKTIPAQESALSYLQTVINHLSGQFSLSGHSKGGNLAVFAGSQIDEASRNNIESILTFDSPGLNQTILNTEGFLAQAEKIQTYVPQDSIIGMLLEMPTDAIIVKSKATGILQHDTFSWVIRGEQFETVPALTASSLQTKQAIKEWTDQLSEEDLKEFFDTFFGLFLDAGFERIGTFDLENRQRFQTLLANQKGLPIEQKELMDRLSKQLVDGLIQARIPTKKAEAFGYLSEVKKDLEAKLHKNSLFSNRFTSR